MGGWDTYERYRDALGKTKRDMWVQNTRANYARKMIESPSFRNVKINDIEQGVCIVHTAEMDQKKIYSMPGEHLEHGGLVDFADNKWLITEMDADNIIYDKGIMQQCNHILRWIGKDGTLNDDQINNIGPACRKVVSVEKTILQLMMGWEDEPSHPCIL